MAAQLVDAMGAQLCNTLDVTVPRGSLTIDTTRELNATTRLSARSLLDVLAEVASPPDQAGLWDLTGPGVATVGYLGGPYVGQGRVLPLLVGLLHGLMRPSNRHGAFQRLIGVDEVNLLARSGAAWWAFTRVGRLVRHLGSTLMLLGQDLNCVPDELFGRAGLCFVFQLRNPKIWEHIRDPVGALRDRRWDEVAALGVWQRCWGSPRARSRAGRRPRAGCASARCAASTAARPARCCSPTGRHQVPVTPPSRCPDEQGVLITGSVD